MRAFLLLLVASCGAKTQLGVDEGSGGSTTTVTGTTSSISSSSTGAGGADSLVCPMLAWAGPPISVAFGGAATSPRLVRVGAERWAVVFQSADGGGGLVTSFPIEDPFGSWPPEVGPPDAHFPTNQTFSATAGDPGQIAFITTDPGSSTILGQSPPGENGCSFVNWPGPLGAIVLADHSPLGPYLYGRLDPLARGAALSLGVVSGFVPSPGITELGAVGCSIDGVPTDAVQTTTGDWFVASAAQAPFVECAEAVGLPGYLQVHRVTPAGELSEAYASDEIGAVAELSMAERSSGAWLAHRLDGEGVVVVHPVTEDGVIDFAQPSHLVGEHTELGRHAITRAKDTWAAAELLPNDAIPGGSLTLHVLVDFALVSTPNDGAAVPHGVPSIAASDEGTSFLVAFEDASGVLPAIGLRRADCVSVR